MTMSDQKHDPADAASASGEAGEGNYKAAREFQAEQHAFASDKDKVRAAAEDAAEALDGPEGEELEKARRETAAKRAA
jgi:hypothetical protein